LAVWRLLLGAYLFGLASILHLVAQGLGLAIPSSLLAMLPYVATIVVLVLLSRMRCAPGYMRRCRWGSRGRPGVSLNNRQQRTRRLASSDAA
jgi:ABC-type uncharacterized transport system permease subunit